MLPPKAQVLYCADAALGPFYYDMNRSKQTAANVDAGEPLYFYRCRRWEVVISVQKAVEEEASKSEKKKRKKWVMVKLHALQETVVLSCDSSLLVNSRRRSLPE